MPIYVRCPICSGSLFREWPDKVPLVIPPNNIYNCNKNPNHKFWSNPYDPSHIQYDPKADGNRWKYRRKWKLENNMYREVIDERVGT